jgi:hypothetical protein
LSGEVTSSHVLVPVSSHCFACVASYRRQPREVAGNESHRVDRVAVGDRQCVGAELGVALPGAVRRARQHTFTQEADMDRHHLTDKAGFDQFLHMHQDRIDARLQTNRRDEPLGCGQRRQFLGFRRRPPERPFAIDMLARLQRRLGRRIVRRHAHDDGDRVDLGRGDHLAPVVERQPGVPSPPRRLGALGFGRADRRQLDIRTRPQRRQMRTRRPGPPDTGADQAQPNPFCHIASSPWKSGCQAV